jgi:dihydrofolate reductase
MRKLVATEFLSLDGVMQSLGSPEEDTSGGFRHGGWSAPYFDETLGQIAGEGMKSTTAYLFGRKTYEHMAAFWPHQPDDDPMAANLNGAAKYVASNTLTDPGWSGTTVLSGDVLSQVAALKEEGEGSIVVLGSGDLLQDLMDDGLVDSFTLFVHPLVIGSGKKLFRDYDDVRRLRLVDSTATGTGVLVLSYDTDRD